MKKTILAFALAALTLLTSSCDDEEVKTMLMFYTCEAKNTVGLSRQTVKMPYSNFEVIANKRECMTSADFDSVDIAEVRTPNGGAIKGFLFNCNERGVKKLFRETSANLGGWILLTENGNPVGLRKIDMIIQDGKLFMLLEFPKGTDLTEKLMDYNKSVQVLSKRVTEEENSLW
ncbi:MAG: hypothetical protein J6P03_09135 [Opitutales bacterium]|nr:hypothetical protein [Opitutales bacterium]